MSNNPAKESLVEGLGQGVTAIVRLVHVLQADDLLTLGYAEIGYQSRGQQLSVYSEQVCNYQKFLPLITVVFGVFFFTTNKVQQTDFKRILVFNVNSIGLLVVYEAYIC